MVEEGGEVAGRWRKMKAGEGEGERGGEGVRGGEERKGRRRGKGEGRKVKGGKGWAG